MTSLSDRVLLYICYEATIGSTARHRRGLWIHGRDSICTVEHTLKENSRLGAADDDDSVVASSGRCGARDAAKRVQKFNATD